MAKNSLIQVRVEDSLKQAADSLFSDLGMDTPTAMRIFLRQSILRNGLPFEVQNFSPNAETIEAIQDVKLNRNMSRTFDSIEELMEDLNA
ncbi:addiction module antitoxin RelB [Clostridia bacterium]|nr:addiction module antitoxin RelB [Clostridia bacterium]